MKPKASGISHMSSKSTGTKAHAELYKDEAREYVRKRLWLDVDGLVALAAPIDGALKRRADTVAKNIAKEFEASLLASPPNGTDIDDSLFSWIRGGAAIGLEKELYGHFDAFMRFVAERVLRSTHVFRPDLPCPKRIVEAFDKHDETRHLRKIHDKLVNVREADSCYPTIVAGGRVQFSRSNDREGAVEDTTASILGGIFHAVAAPMDNLGSGSTKEDPRLVPFRAHKRIATTPVGKPLRHLNCPLKLIKVMADVMRLLIDFDHAVDVSVPKITRHLDRSGTLPFMSINNLAGNIQWVTGLDDWESALYLMCWIGTYGFNKNQAPDPAILDKLKIRKWCEGSLDDIAWLKRMVLDSENSLYRLTAQFLQDLPMIGHLKDLAHALRTNLISNPDVGIEFHGAQKKSASQ
ncbi:hypothetical protein EV177_007366, partial [Coemansia sp. RSA 1804]